MLLYTSLRTFGISCWPRSGVCPPARRALTRAVRIAASHTCQSGAWRLCHLNNAPLAHRKSWRLRAHSRTAPEVFSLPLNLGLPASCRRFPLSPSSSERVGERGPCWAWGSGPQSASNGRGVLSRGEGTGEGWGWSDLVEYRAQTCAPP